jgi:SOS-response transcriptional repressor LexA
MTNKQAKLLTFIRSYIKEHGGRSPNFNEMAKAMGLKSKSGIHRLVKALVYHKKIRHIPDRARSIEVIEDNNFVISVLNKAKFIISRLPQDACGHEILPLGTRHLQDVILQDIDKAVELVSGSAA